MSPFSERIRNDNVRKNTTPLRTITYNTSFLTQFRWVLKRTFLNLMLNPQTSIAQVFTSPSLSSNLPWTVSDSFSLDSTHFFKGRIKGKRRKMIWCDNTPRKDAWNSCNTKCKFNSNLVMTTFTKHHFELYINYISCESRFTLNTSHWKKKRFSLYEQ